MYHKNLNISQQLLSKSVPDMEWEIHCQHCSLRVISLATTFQNGGQPCFKFRTALYYISLFSLVNLF